MYIATMTSRLPIVILRPVQKSTIDMVSGSVKVASGKRGKSIDEIMVVTRKKVAGDISK